VAREVHGRIPPTAFFALPFIYGFPFMFGFVNYALSVALAFLAFGLWLHLGLHERFRLRACLFAPISLVLFFCHIYGWGLLGLLCSAAEVVRQHDRGRPWWKAAISAALHVSILAAPLVVIVASPAETQGGPRIAWFAFESKWRWVYAALRDRWGVFDMASLAFAALMFFLAMIDARLTLSRILAFSAALLAAFFLVVPPVIFDSAYADMRLVPYVFAVALLSIRLRPATDLRLAHFLAIVAILFFSVRTAANTASLAIAAMDQKAKLHAIEFIPRGARVATFYGLPAAEPWALPRNSHLGAFVIVRREGFSNEQWITAGHNLLVLKYRAAGAFSSDPSEVVRPSGAEPGPYRTIDRALLQVPRPAFDYIWLINAPTFDAQLVTDLQPVWRGPGTILYRVKPTESSVKNLSSVPSPHGQLSGHR
jgi:hypothetical protein